VLTPFLPQVPSDGYKEILESIVGKIKAAQTRAMSAVNRELIEVYRDIGRIIYEQQQNGEWGVWRCDGRSNL
jgi:hypothetical protein